MERGDLITWEKGGGGEVSQDLLTSRDPNNVSREQSAEGWIIRRTEIKGKRPTVFLISAKPSPFLRSPIECILGVQISSSPSPLFFFPNSRFYCLNQPRDRFRISLVQFSRCIRTIVFQIKISCFKSLLPLSPCEIQSFLPVAHKPFQ